jgi:hypothetical protein
MKQKYYYAVNFFKIVSITYTLLLCSCSEGNKKIPITESKFMDVLTDIHFHEARLEQFTGLTDTFYFSAGKGYEKIYEKHGITKDQFMETFSYYEQQPKEFEKLYEKIVDKLSEEEAKAGE